jgi:flagellar hook-associated protein 1 FlgK
LNLSRDLWTQISNTALLDVKESYLNRIQQFHGPPDKELSIAAELAQLHDSFSALADSPEDRFLQSSHGQPGGRYRQQDQRAFAPDHDACVTTRRDRSRARSRASTTCSSQIAELNVDIANSTGVGRSTAALEDKRDDAIKELSEMMDLTFFTRGDGAIVVQTSQGVELASTRATLLTFRRHAAGGHRPIIPRLPPAFMSAIRSLDPVAVDITEDAPGGRLGGLLELTRRNFPETDGAARRTGAQDGAALRGMQGLRLFTDGSGNIPPDTAPDPTVPTPVGYVGFSGVIQVNENILADNTILQSGTYGATICDGIE